MDTHKRLQKIANQKAIGARDNATESGLAHVHIQGGRAWACDGLRLYSAPSTRPDCPHDCGWPQTLIDQVRKNQSDIRAMVDVTHTHLKRAVKLGLAMYSGKNQKTKRDSAGQRWLKLSANGGLDVSADSEWGSTTTRLEHGAQWNERKIMRKGIFRGYKTSEVTYRKAGDDTSGFFEGDKLLDALMLAQDVQAERVELLLWKTAISDGITLTANGIEVLLMGRALEA